MTDADMYQIIEKGMRGGISYIANRHGRANNKYMQDYDKNQSSKYITYLVISTLIIFTVGQGVNIYLLANSSG